MDDLVRWLEAQLAEDERIARAASGGTVVGEPGNWSPAPGGDEWEASRTNCDEDELLVALRPGRPRPPDVMSGMWGAVVDFDPAMEDSRVASPLPQFEHAARHDPARVLREIDAKRRMVRALFAYEAKIDGEWGCCHDADDIAAGLCPETRPKDIPGLLLLASVYRDRPGFREEWRP